MTGTQRARAPRARTGTLALRGCVVLRIHRACVERKDRARSGSLVVETTRRRPMTFEAGVRLHYDGFHTRGTARCARSGPEHTMSERSVSDVVEDLARRQEVNDVTVLDDFVTSADPSRRPDESPPARLARHRPRSLDPPLPAHPACLSPSMQPPREAAEPDAEKL
jgi:hypothetical protein